MSNLFQIVLIFKKEKPEAVISSLICHFIVKKLFQYSYNQGRKIKTVKEI